MEACTLCILIVIFITFINRQSAGEVQCMIQMTLTRMVKVLEFTAMITQTSWIQNIVFDTIKE